MAENERRGEHQKQKLLYLAKLFTEETDTQHALGMAEIIDKLAVCGVNADRKTLYLDFQELRDFGMEIEAVKAGRNTLYRLASRRFELPELKLLVDSVQSAKFITDKKSKELIAKLESLVSRHEATQLQRQVIISDRIKDHEHERLLQCGRDSRGHQRRLSNSLQVLSVEPQKGDGAPQKRRLVSD